MAKREPRVSVIIPTKDEERYLPKLLHSIEGQRAYQRGDVEIIVADAGSEDRTRSIAEEYGCKIVEGGMPAIGRNNGAAVARGKALGYFDSDIILPNRDFLDDALGEMDRRGLDVAGTLLRVIPVKRELNSKAALANILYRTLFEGVNVSFVLSQYNGSPLMQSCMFARRDAHRGISGFPDLEFGEDSAFAKRAVKLGYRFGVLEACGKVPLSMRRFENEGILNALGKCFYFNRRRLLGGEIPRGEGGRKYFE